jgi:hypothetical protein
LAATEQLERFAQSIEAHREEHVRETLKGSFYYGQFAGAGALAFSETEARLLRAIEVRREAVGEDNTQHQKRVAVVQDQLRRGFSSPRLPETDPGALRAAEDLMRPVLGESVSLAEAGERIAHEIRTADGRTKVVTVTTGAGKTEAALLVAAERDAAGLRTVIVGPTHALLRELKDRLWARFQCAARHWRSPTAVVEGDFNCLKLPLVKAAAETGNRPSKTVCPTCEHRNACPIFRPNAIEANVHLIPREMIGLLDNEKIGLQDALLIVDEDIPPVETRSLTAAELNAPLKLEHVAYAYHARLLPALETHRLGASLPTVGPFRMTVQMAQEGERVTSADAFKDPDTVRTLKVLDVVGRVVDRNACSVSFEAGGLIVKTFTPIAERVLSKGGVVLSATPFEAMWRFFYEAALRTPGLPAISVSRFNVPDAHPSVRVLLYMADASLAHLAPNNTPSWSEIGSGIRALLKRAKQAGSKRVLLMTFKVIAEGLKGPHANLLSGFPEGAITVAHYGSLEGRDGWKDRDAFVTYGDPWVPSADRKLVRGSWDDSRYMVRSALAQAHGRARDPRRDSSAFHLHGGQVPPLGWTGENTRIERLEKGRRPTEPAMDLTELEALAKSLGAPGVAALAECAPSSIYRYLAGRGVPERTAKKIREGLAREQAKLFQSLGT